MFASQTRIYLISNCPEEAIYRAFALRKHIESAQPTYREKEQEQKEFPFALVLFLLNLYFLDQVERLNSTKIGKISNLPASIATVSRNVDRSLKQL